MASEPEALQSEALQVAGPAGRGAQAKELVAQPTTWDQGRTNQWNFGTKNVAHLTYVCLLWARLRSQGRLLPGNANRWERFSVQDKLGGNSRIVDRKPLF